MLVSDASPVSRRSFPTCLSAAAAVALVAVFDGAGLLGLRAATGEDECCRCGGSEDGQATVQGDSLEMCVALSIATTEFISILVFPCKDRGPVLGHGRERGRAREGPLDAPEPLAPPPLRNIVPTY